MDYNRDLTPYQMVHLLKVKSMDSMAYSSQMELVLEKRYLQGISLNIV